MTNTLTTDQAATILGLTHRGVLNAVYQCRGLVPENRTEGGPSVWRFTPEAVERFRVRRDDGLRRSGRGVWQWGRSIEPRVRVMA